MRVDCIQKPIASDWNDFYTAPIISNVSVGQASQYPDYAASSCVKREGASDLPAEASFDAMTLALSRLDVEPGRAWVIPETQISIPSDELIPSAVGLDCTAQPGKLPDFSESGEYGTINSQEHGKLIAEPACSERAVHRVTPSAHPTNAHAFTTRSKEKGGLSHRNSQRVKPG